MSGKLVSDLRSESKFEFEFGTDHILAVKSSAIPGLQQTTYGNTGVQ